MHSGTERIDSWMTGRTLCGQNDGIHFPKHPNSSRVGLQRKLSSVVFGNRRQSAILMAVTDNFPPSLSAQLPPGLSGGSKNSFNMRVIIFISDPKIQTPEAVSSSILILSKQTLQSIRCGAFG